MSRVCAVLGPTNTGKTHLAIERLCAHSSGMIGFPLRLLAREVYDRVVAIKGADAVGLVTGEEKILPPGARWLLCTTESMPADRDLAFVALDEAQLGTDPERGHVFTDRLLRVRGRDETMILGSDSLKPLIRTLIPEAEIIARPRFSTLSYAGAKKLSRLPKRTAIVAFSAAEVYAVAEMLRRARGGAAVVMGALSPRTRNAQVAMFQSGEVDYLVATDAIGMGLNMDVAHVAFADLAKYDGHRTRRLTIAELAQIAGRAGRHQRDGTFGSLGGEHSPSALRAEEIAAIEAHRFPRLRTLFWRNGDPDYESIATLLATLSARSDRAELRMAPEATDLAVLRRLADDPLIRDRARSPAQVRRLWAACGLPDFRKIGADGHGRMVERLFHHLSEGEGHVPVPWIADELARLDRVDGDVDTLGARISAVRTWSYISGRADWLADPAHWAGRAQDLEMRLSDALHARLIERFVDRRTAVLVREAGLDPALLDVAVADDGTVSVAEEPIGRLDGFTFSADRQARAGDMRRLIAVAERRLPKELKRRADRLIAAPDADFALIATAGQPPFLAWQGVPVMRLVRGRNLVAPGLRLAPSLERLAPGERRGIRERLSIWVERQLDRHLAPLQTMVRAATDPAVPPEVRAVLAMVAADGGSTARGPVDRVLERLIPENRAWLRQQGLTIGTLDLFDARLLKPEALRWRAALMAVWRNQPVPAIAPVGRTVWASDQAGPGFRHFGPQSVRVDLVERLARALHDRRQARRPFTPDPSLARGLGLDACTFAAVMRASGFRGAGEGAWVWHHRPRAVEARRPRSTAFAALEHWGQG